MATGSVTANGETLWLWEAVRSSSLLTPPKADQVVTYQCTVARLHGQRLQFEVQHRYGDPGYVLAAKVLQRAAAATTGEATE